MFERKGLITIEAGKNGKTFDELFDLAIEGGAEDVKEVQGENGPEWEVYTDQTELNTVSTFFSAPERKEDFPILASELTFVASNPLAVGEEGGIDEQRAEAVAKMTEGLELQPSIVKVWTNLE